MKYENLNLLSLNLTGAWFDLISENKKKNEYRLVEKWKKRVEPLIKDFENGKPLYLCLYRGYTKICIMVKCTSITVKNGLETDLKVDEYVYDFAFEKVFSLVPINRKTINKEFQEKAYKVHFAFFLFLDKMLNSKYLLPIDYLDNMIKKIMDMRNDLTKNEIFFQMQIVAEKFGLPNDHYFFSSSYFNELVLFNSVNY